MTPEDIYDIELISKGPLNIFKIYENFQACMYLVCGQEKKCLTDTAFGFGDLAAITGQLSPLPVTVVNTHGHIDHVLGNHYFDKAYIHPADRELYKEVADNFANIAEDAKNDETFGALIGDNDFSSVKFPSADDLGDGDVIDLGGKVLRVIGMPGHTEGSIMLIDEDEKICFSGDSILEHPWLFLEESQPLETYLDSLRRASDILKNSGIERIYSGHYSYKPLTLEDLDKLICGVEDVIAGKLEGKPFTNHAGSGLEYEIGEFSILCPEGTGAEGRISV